MFVIFIVVFIVDKVGCKLVLKIGFSVMVLGILVLGYCLMQFDNGIVFSGFFWFFVGMIMMCIVGYVMSVVLVVWIFCFEIQLLKCCDFGIICLIIINWVLNMIIGVIFLMLFDVIGVVGIFWFYMVFNVVFIGIIFWLILEIKNVIFEYIECNLMVGEKLCNIGNC